MKFYLISDNNDTYIGMRMAGIEGVVVHQPHEVEAELKKAAADPDIGVVLITAKLTALCRDMVYDYKLNAQHLLIVEVPDRHGEGGVTQSITRYLQDAMGMKL